MRVWVLVVILWAAGSEAWFWSSNPEPTTESPAAATGGGTTPPAGGADMTTKKKVEEEDDNLSGVGEEIINVATGIRKFVQAWDATPTPTPTPTLIPGTTNGSLTEKVERANPNKTGNADGFGGERVEEGSGVWAGNESGSEVDPEPDVESVMLLRGDKLLHLNLTGNVSKTNQTVNASEAPCLPVPSDWPVCSGKMPKFFTLPNFFNHTSVEQVGEVLQTWAGLAKAGCHPNAEWFLCLLLAPGCPSAPALQPLPCRSFCHFLRDSCWASLEGGRFPVECDLLPERAQEAGRPPACVSVSKWKGNRPGWNVSCEVIHFESDITSYFCARFLLWQQAPEHLPSPFPP